jgi:hypothetical protein
MWVATLCLPVGIASADGIAPTVSFTLKDGPGVLDGVADEIYLPEDATNFGRVFRSINQDAEHYVEFSLSGAEPATAALLVLALEADDLHLVYGESKSFTVSTYEGTGQVTADVFGYGELLEGVTLATNGVHDVDLEISPEWNAAVAAGDDFLGVRIHDPVWTGTPDPAGTIWVGSVTISGVIVPEPSAPLLAGAAVLMLALLPRSRRNRP